MFKGAHDHSSRILGVCLETRAAIEKLLEIDPNMKPGKIIKNLEKDSNIKIPLKADLNNFLHTVRVKKYGSNMNLGELASWCLDHCIFDL